MTKPLRILIAEDEPILAQVLAQAITRLQPQVQIVAIAEHGIAARDLARHHCPDVLFLDIKMPGLTGLEVAQELADEWPMTQAFPLLVFVTAYEQFALEAFDVAAVDYLCKPISDERLQRTLDRIDERRRQHDSGAFDATDVNPELTRVLHQLQSLLPTPSAPPASGHLKILRAAVGNQIRMIPIDTVLFIEATDKYLRVVTADQESLIRLSLKELLPQLDAQQFWQIHRGTVVNANQIRHAQRDEAGRVSLVLHNHAEVLRVSRVFAHLFRQM